MIQTFKRIKKLTLKTGTLKFSWAGRAAILKMMALPRLLYLFHALPIDIPPTFFNKLTTAKIHFLWAYKQPRIQLKLLTLPKFMREMALPDFRKYYYSTHIARIIDCNCNDKNKDWVELEKSGSHPLTQFVPWSNPSKYPLIIKNHPLINTILKFFQKTVALHNLSTIPSPLSSLADNPDFPLGINNKTLLQAK